MSRKHEKQNDHHGKAKQKKKKKKVERNVKTLLVLFLLFLMQNCHSKGKDSFAFAWTWTTTTTNTFNHFKSITTSRSVSDFCKQEQQLQSILFGSSSSSSSFDNDDVVIINEDDSSSTINSMESSSFQSIERQTQKNKKKKPTLDQVIKQLELSQQQEEEENDEVTSKDQKKKSRSKKKKKDDKDGLTPDWMAKYRSYQIYRKNHPLYSLDTTRSQEPPLTHPELGKWIRTQRRHYKKWQQGQSSPLTQQRIHLLKQADFAFDPSQAEWDAKLEVLKEYITIFGNAKITSRHPQLGNWVKTMRGIYRKRQQAIENNEPIIPQSTTLTDERIARLNEIGFVWDIRRKVYEENVEQAKAANRTLASWRETDGPLGLWMCAQKLKYRKYLNSDPNHSLQPYQIKLLKEELGFDGAGSSLFNPREEIDIDNNMDSSVMSPNNQNDQDGNDKNTTSQTKPKRSAVWDARIQQLLEFKRIHGHTCVPRHYPNKLGAWVKKVRELYRRKAEVYVGADIDPSTGLPRDESILKKNKKKKKKQKKTTAKSNGKVSIDDLEEMDTDNDDDNEEKEEEDLTLSDLDIKRLKQLLELDFVFDALDFRYQVKIQNLTDFKEFVGHPHVPDVLPTLGPWLNVQRNKYHTAIHNPSDSHALRYDRAWELTNMGVDWYRSKTVQRRHDRQFRRRVKEFIAFRRDNPGAATYQMPSKLRFWVEQQRSYYRKWLASTLPASTTSHRMGRTSKDEPMKLSRRMTESRRVMLEEAGVVDGIGNDRVDDGVSNAMKSASSRKQGRERQYQEQLERQEQQKQQQQQLLEEEEEEEQGQVEWDGAGVAAPQQDDYYF